MGATRWPEAVALPLQSGVRVGYGAPRGRPDLGWYRGRDAWLFAVLPGVLMHVAVDFDL